MTKSPNNSDESFLCHLGVENFAEVEDEDGSRRIVADEHLNPHEPEIPRLNGFELMSSDPLGLMDDGEVAVGDEEIRIVHSIVVDGQSVRYQLVYRKPQ